MLYKHQQQVVDSAPNKHGIFFDVGVGKTLTAIKLLEKNAPEIGLALIITTKSLKRNWQNELIKWFKPRVFVNIRIMSKEEFRKDWSTLPYFPAIVVDELHFFGGYKSQMHKSLANYINKHDPKFIWGLTATPILSSVISVWALAKLLGYPMNFRKFVDRFFYKIKLGHRYIPKQKTGIESEIAEILRRIGTVVSKEEALDLPPVTHKFEYFTLTREQTKAIKDLDKDPTTVAKIVYHTKVLQIASGTLKTEDGYKVIKSEKLARIKELAEQYPKMVIVARHKAELDMLQKALGRGFIYSGDTPEYERDDIIRMCNENEKAILLLQADSGIGFNLQGMNLMVFYTHTWDYTRYYQCMGRLLRLTQKEPCTFIHFITENTVDQKVWECLERKQNFDIHLYSRTKV